MTFEWRVELHNNKRSVFQAENGKGKDTVRNVYEMLKGKLVEQFG